MLMEYDLKLLHIETKAKIEITGTINIGWVNCNVIYLITLWANYCVP